MFTSLVLIAVCFVVFINKNSKDYYKIDMVRMLVLTMIFDCILAAIIFQK